MWFGFQTPFLVCWAMEAPNWHYRTRSSPHQVLEQGVWEWKKNVKLFQKWEFGPWDFFCTPSRMLSLTLTFCFAGDSPGQESLGPIQQAWHWDDHYKSRKVTTTRYFNSKSYASFLLVWYLWWGIAVGRGSVSWTLWPFSQIKSLLISYPTVQWPGSHILNVFDCNGVISDMIVVLGV